MKKNYVSLAGMAVCVLGVLSTSSCSKDEFFGLEDSVYLDNSLKTEIAMSQEFADYTLACLNLANEMNQPIDTAEMQIQGLVNGKPIYLKTASYENVKEMIDNLREAFPELVKADKLDFKEMQEIALLKNKSLKGLAKSTKYVPSWSDPQSEIWIYSASGGTDNYSMYYGGWFFDSHWSVYSAVSEVLWYCGEGGFNMNGGGLIFGDYTAVSMIGYDEYWPSIVNSGPRAEADFLVAPNVDLSSLEVWDIAWRLGPGYYGGGRIHHIFNEEMQSITFFY